MEDCFSWGSIRKSGLERMEQEGREEPGTLLWCPECLAVMEVFYRIGEMGRSDGLGTESVLCATG